MNADELGPARPDRSSSAMLVGLLLFAVLRFGVAAARASAGANAQRWRRVAAARVGAGGRDRQAQGAGARDGGARRSVRAVERRDRRQPHVGPGRRGQRRPRADRQPGGAADPRSSTSRRGCPTRRLLDEVPALRDVIAESLRTSQPVLRRTLALERPGEPMHLGVSVSPLAAERAPAGAICLFSDLTDVVRARRTAAAEGGARAARRADRGSRARVPQRPRDHSRLRAADGSGGAAGRSSGRTSKAFATRRRRSARSSRGFSTSPGRSRWRSRPSISARSSSARPRTRPPRD